MCLYPYRVYGFVVFVCVCVKVNGMRGFGNNEVPYTNPIDPLGHRVNVFVKVYVSFRPTARQHGAIRSEHA